MLIGIDFDNTIVQYDKLFHKICCEEKLIPKSTPQCKTAIRDFLRNKNKEDEWTKIQGYVYGKRMSEAPPSKGVLNFFAFCKRNKIPTYIVSHKTRYPYKGEKYDLHSTAKQWIERNSLYNILKELKGEAFFEPTKEKKIERISKLKCTHFIDDLPEFLLEPSFPKTVTTIHYGKKEQLANNSPLLSYSRWEEIENYFNNLLSL